MWMGILVFRLGNGDVSQPFPIQEALKELISHHGYVDGLLHVKSADFDVAVFRSGVEVGVLFMHDVRGQFDDTSIGNGFLTAAVVVLVLGHDAVIGHQADLPLVMLAWGSLT